MKPGYQTAPKAQVMIGFISVGLVIVSSTIPEYRITKNEICVSCIRSIRTVRKDIIRERTMAGLSAARARGRVGGRPDHQ